MEEYITIAEEATGELVAERSRFIATLSHVESEAEAAAFIARMKSHYFDARHNVYAYRLADGTARFSDDGEPHSTAGKPVLEVLVGAGLLNAAMVVTRYFGGVLLGTGGLVRAYSGAASAAVANAKMLYMRECDRFRVVCSYAGYEPLCAFLNNSGARIENSEFTDSVTLYFSIAASDSETILSAMSEKFFGRIKPEHLVREFAAL